MMIKMDIRAKIGQEWNTETGRMEVSPVNVMSTPLFYRITTGSRVTLQKKAYQYRYAFYSLQRPEEYIYTYAYEKEQNWSTYCQSKSVVDWLTKTATFSEDGYIRLSVMHHDRRELTNWEAENVGEILCLETEAEEEYRKRRERVFLARQDVQEEIQRTVQSIRHAETENSLTFTLLTDTHYVVNGTWEETTATIRAIHEQSRPDGIIHLGDLSDGMLDKEICAYYSNKVIADMKSWGLPLYFAIGNHDANYFGNNQDRLSEKEQYTEYLRGIVDGRLVENQLWYEKDFPQADLRFLFLHSFDYKEKNRYGFPEEEVQWLKQMLEETPKEYRIILFSHDAPLARLDYWAKEIRNGEMLTEVLENWHETHGKRIMAFLHGHTHADYIYKERSFPIVSIACSKCEYFPDKKPEGAIAYRREIGEVTQELWDTLIVDTKNDRMDFIRFGAGTNRRIERGQEVRENFSTKIWAHRGASGYAPENTLEAFGLAVDMQADGVELDVQFSKDRQLVVIHDESIDRVSDGTGSVDGYTLEELKQFNFNKMHPEYGVVRIPTLKEVLELLKPTKLTVNIELKTGVKFYEGIEDAVIRLVEEMGMEKRIIYSSFNHHSVLKIKRLRPEAQTGFLYCDGPLNMPEYAVNYGVDALHPALYNIKYPQFTENCREKGIKLHVWTVNNEVAMQEMAAERVDAFITNYPDMARKALYGEGISYTQMKQKGLIRTLDSAAGNEGHVNTGSAQMEAVSTVEQKRRTHFWPVHVCGVLYGKVRCVCVKIDSVVQRMAKRE